MRKVRVERGQAQPPANPEWFPGTVYQQRVNEPEDEKGGRHEEEQSGSHASSSARRIGTVHEGGMKGVERTPVPSPV